MKYGDLIEFEPIDEVKEIRRADDPEQAREDVRTYVISDPMAYRLRDVVFPALDLAQSGERKCLLIVATYGTGKTHLMSVITSLAERADLLSEVTHPEVVKAAEKIAGRYKVIRQEIGATKMPLRDIICGMLEDGLASMGVTYKFPSADKVPNTKDSLVEMMAAFEAKYPDQGLLLALDELLDYLRQRRDTDFIYDLAILRELGEIARGSRFRFIAGIQEALFDNPRFESAADAIRRVRDRYQQVSIVRDDVAFVVKNRLLRKTVGQRDRIELHLRSFSAGFEGLAEDFDEYVSLFPVHPSYLETFENLQVVEKRRILASLSAAMRKVMDDEVPTNAPGLVCYDSYRQELEDDKTNRAVESVREVLEKTATLRNRVGRALQPPDDIPLALRIVDALAVHRLTTANDIRSRIGPTPTELRDDLMLLPPGVPLDPLLLGESVQNVIEEIGKAASWQFIHQDPDTHQVFIAVDKAIDYDRKIEERAKSLDEYELDRAYFSALEMVLDQRDRPYQASINIWEYQIRWATKRVTRRGYLFFGAPNERSTAKPPRDFYLYFLQPFAPPDFSVEDKPDEVFFRLDTPDEEFRAALKRYAGAVAMDREAASAEHQRVYQEKWSQALEEMTAWLRSNMDRAMTVTYAGESMLLGERFAPLGVQRGAIKSVVDAIASAALSDHFEQRYPGYPAFQADITYGADGNLGEMVRQAIAGIVSGRPSQSAARILSSLELTDVKGVSTPSGTYAKALREQIKNADPMAVNRAELLHELDRGVDTWGPWNLEPAWLTVVAASLCQQGRLELGFPGGQIDATTLGQLNSKSLEELEAISHVAPPKPTPIVILKAVVELVGLRASDIPAGGVNDQLVKIIIDGATSLRNRVAQATTYVREGIQVWGQDVIDRKEERLARLEATSSVVEDLMRRTSIGLLNKISMTGNQVAKAKEGIEELQWVEQTKRGADAFASDVSYLRSARDVMADADPLKDETEDLRKRILDAFLDGSIEAEEVTTLKRDTAESRRRYVDTAARAHGRDRLDAAGDDRKRELLVGDLFRSLEILAGVTLLPEDRLRSIREKLATVIGCREFDERDLSLSVVCPHCDYRPQPSQGPTALARLEAVADDARTVRGEWERTLVDAVREPDTQEKIGALGPQQRAIIERLGHDRRLPDDVGLSFVGAVNAALERFVRRNATAADLWRALFPTSSPATVEELRNRFDDFLRRLADGSEGRPIRVVPSEETVE